MKGPTLLSRMPALVLASATVLGLTGCASVGYYWQSAAGHLKVMNAAKPVSQLLEDGATPERLRARLALSQRIRDYAVRELNLPDNVSYRRYADLRRNAAVWNVVAAPEFSLTLKTWCFAVVGCVSYRGYFDESKARAESAGLAGQGLETSVYPVPAYSTLGWMNWAGGDPLLNTFIYYPEGELARLVFHELAHQVVYVKDDTVFNESFATAVERLGSAGWLASQASDAARSEYADYDARRRQFRALTLLTRDRLKEIYEQKEGPGAAPSARAAMKSAAMRDFRERYRLLRMGWGGDAARYRGYDQWVAAANNAAFGAQAAYDDLVPGFETLFVSQGRDWQRFYLAVKRLALLPKDQRHKQLKELPGA